MSKTVDQLTATELRQFDPTRNFEASLAPAKWEKAWQIVSQLAHLLRSNFHAQRVVAFGSITQPESFTHWSDIDLAVWGIPPTDFYKALAALNEITPDFDVDLIDPENCTSELLKHMIEQEGIDIEPTT